MSKDSKEPVMSEDSKQHVDANSAGFKQGVEAGLNSEEDTKNWKAGNELGHALKEEGEIDADTRTLLKTLLGFSDFEAVVAPDVEAAYRLREREQFSLYILDGGLRKVTGQSLCAQIRAADARMPIVIFSGHAFASDIEAGMLAGANAYLVKPDFSKLIPTISSLLEATSQ